MPILDKIFHRGNSDKNLANNTNANANTNTHANVNTGSAVAGRSYELPAETTTNTNSNLAGRSYELPAEETITVRQETLIAPGANNSSSVYQSAEYGTSTYIQGENRGSIGVVRAEPTVIETIQKDVVVHERFHPVEKEEIQPVIYREREQLDVKQITQLLHETQVQPTIFEQRELAGEVRETVVERGATIQENLILPTTQREATLRTQQIHAPIIEETIKKTIIEEVQPVLERDVFVPTIVQNTQPIYEKIVEAPIVYRETREVQELGTREVGYAQAPFVQAPIVQAPIVVERELAPAPLQVVPITTTTTVETYDHKLNPIQTRDFINNRGLPTR